MTNTIPEVHGDNGLTETELEVYHLQERLVRALERIAELELRLAKALGEAARNGFGPF